MNFFERQRAARGTTVKLVVLFTLAVICIVAALDAIVWYATRGQEASSVVGYLIAASAVSLLIVGGGTLTKTLALRAGGPAVALSVGAVAVDPTTSDPQLRRLVNIVEEMAIASGVPAPRIFVLEREAGINAFAAGYSPADAAITVTGGALRTLNRDELQGVIGHEFSHILNGDMRLNIRLIGLLNGLLLMGLIGLRVLAFSGGGGRSDSDRKGGGAPPILLFAIGMMILGFIGQFFAGLIKAAVSRQREWLADASAVQFTRQTTGLAGALKKIAGLPAGSRLADSAAASQLSHMLFGEGGRSLSQLYATHPPLLKRIAALDPTFDPREVAALQQQYAERAPNGLAEDAARGLVPAGTAPLATASAAVPAAVAESAGTLTPVALARGAELSARIPAQLRQLAAQPSTAVEVVLALALSGDPTVRAAQYQDASAALGPEAADTAVRFADSMQTLAPELRLPVLSIAAPQLAARPAPLRSAVAATLERLVHRDNRLTLFEYCLTRLVASYLRDAADPSRRSRAGRVDPHRVEPALLTLLAAVAATGNDDVSAAAHAFGTAAEHVLPGRNAGYRPPADWTVLDAGWEQLDALDPSHKQRLVEAMVLAVRDDGVLTLNEAELLRTACALLHCPLPGFVG